MIDLDPFFIGQIQDQDPDKKKWILSTGCKVLGMYRNAVCAHALNSFNTTSVVCIYSCIFYVPLYQ